MGNLRILFQLILADFRERSRRYSFLMIILANLFLSYQVFIGNFTPRLGYHRGADNAAWVGAAITCTCTLMLIIFGFYLVKNSISRDLQTGVGQILAGTRLGKILYLFGKVLSNFAVLAVIIVIIAVSALLMLLAFGSEGYLDLWQLWAPFVFVALPPMFLVAALVVLFESIPFLRGGYGNVIYFFAILTALPVGMDLQNPVFDFMGFGLFIESMERAVLAQYPGANVSFNLNPEHIADLKVFLWEGIDWSVAIFLPKLALFGAGVLVTLVASVFFNRFDPSRKVLMRDKQPKPAGQPLAVNHGAGHCALDLDLPAGHSLDFSLFPMVLEETKLMLKGQHKVWYALVLGLIIAQIAAPFSVVRGYLLPIAWCLPVLIWSSMGVRDNLHGTRQLMLSMPYPGSRQIASTWIAGILVALVTASGAVLHSLVIGDMHYLAALIIGACFVPTLAISSGLLSHTSRLFETVYAVIWYAGLLNHLPQLDFAGAVPNGFDSGIPFFYLLISVCLIALVLLVRRYQIRFT